MSGYKTIFRLVVPLSVLSNWETQIKEHCAAGALDYLIYYESGRTATAERLSKVDVVITTYQIVAGEHDSNSTIDANVSAPSQKRRRTNAALFEVAWKVIILKF